jgi:hypothetical protein
MNIYGGLTPRDLQGLRAFETYQALCANGRMPSPASAATLLLGEPLGTLGAVVRNTREHYGTARGDTDAALLARRSVGGDLGGGAIGSRRRRGQP